MKSSHLFVAAFAFRKSVGRSIMSAATTKSISSSPDPNSSIQKLFDHLRKNKNAVLLLDGGTGEELFARGLPDDRKTWSAKALSDSKYHSMLSDVHKSFLDAGSDAITTNSYGVTPGVGFSEAEITKHVATAGKIARDVANAYSTQKLVLGSLGPLVESYRPDLILDPPEKGVKMYTTVAETLSPYVDVFIAETMSCVKESSQAIKAVGRLNKDNRCPMIVSYTLDSDGNLRDGDPATNAVEKTLAMSRENNVELLAVLFNCAEPEAVSKALKAIHEDENLQRALKERGVLTGAYANRLTAVDPSWTMADSDTPQPFRNDLDPKMYSDDFVSTWVKERGCQVVGGCCGITPEHISYINSHLGDNYAVLDSND